MPHRRAFLRAALLSLAPVIPAFLTRTARAAGPRRDGRVLVVVQLDGGNDGINTVVPFADEGYARHRRALRLPAGQVIKLDDRVGLHPALADAARLLEGGRLAVVQGVGYPNPSRSHFRSMAVWHTARLDPEGHDGLGWLGRALDPGAVPDGPPASLSVAAGPVPVALRGRRAAASALTRPEEFALSPLADPRPASFPQSSRDDLAAFVRRTTVAAYATADRVAAVVRPGPAAGGYPPTDLAVQLRTVAQLLKADLGARVFYTVQPGYDTHVNQLATHARLLAELGGAVRAFLDDLAEAGLAERVLVLAFSEFGRRVAENASAGTDHGTAGPVLLAGARVRAGLVGATPGLLDLEDGDLKTGPDFRQVYATVLADWLGVAPAATLGADFPRLPLLR